MQGKCQKVSKERKKTMNYSNWVTHWSTWSSSHAGLVTVPMMIIGLAVIILANLGWIVNRRRQNNEQNQDGKRMITGIDLLAAISIMLIGSLVIIDFSTASTSEHPEFFESYTQNVYGVSRFECAKKSACIRVDQGYLPKNRTTASWMENDRFVHGMILVDGTTVQLVDDQGNILKPIVTEPPTVKTWNEVNK